MSGGPEVNLTGGGSLKLFYAYTEVEIQMNMAFVYLKCSFINNTAVVEDGVFTYPASENTGSTVCGCDLTWNGKTFRSAVIDPSTQKLNTDDKLSSVATGGGKGSGTHYNPRLFSMPFHGMPGHSEMIVELRFVQTMTFDADTGNYSMKVPMTLPSTGMFPGRSFKENIRYHVVLSGGSKSSWKSDSHTLQAATDGAITTLSGNGESNKDFHVGYHAWSDKITGSALVQSTGGSFVMFLQPPSNLEAKAISRKVVFLIDRSFSMISGTIMESAKTAVLTALNDLTTNDSFSICAFDDKMKWFQGGNAMCRVNEQTISSAKEWVNDIKPSGLTDILTPYQKALELLNTQGPLISGSGNNGKIYPEEDSSAVPYVILITDGAVGKDQDKGLMKCATTSQRAFATNGSGGRRVRTFTYGIGPFANRYMLSQLADAGNGYSEVCLNVKNIERSMSRFLSKTRSPVLADIEMDIQGVDIELFPSSIPDLTVGAPLIVCGRFHNGSFPSEFTVKGHAYGQQQVNIKIKTVVTEKAPVHALVEKARLDVLVGKWYMADNDSDQKRYKQQAIDGSIESSMPCVFTQGIAYESPNAINVVGLEAPPSGIAAPSITKYNDKFDANNRIQRSGNGSGDKHQNHNNKSAVVGVVACALLATGIGAAFAFGNVNATAAGTSVIDAMANISSFGFDGLATLAEGGWNAVEAVDWGGLGAGIQGALGSVVDVAGDIGSSAIDAVGSIDVSGALETVGDGAGSAINAIGDAGSSVVDQVGNANIIGTLEGLGHTIADGAGSAINAISGAVSDLNVGSAIESVGEHLGEAVSFVGDNAGAVVSAVGDHAGEAISFVGEHAGEVVQAVGESAAFVAEHAGDIVEPVGAACCGIMEIFK